MHAVRDKQDTLCVSYVEKQRPAEWDVGKSKFDWKLRIEITYAGIASQERLGNGLGGQLTHLTSDHVDLLQNCLAMCETNWLTEVN